VCVHENFRVRTRTFCNILIMLTQIQKKNDIVYNFLVLNHELVDDHEFEKIK